MGRERIPVKLVSDLIKGRSHPQLILFNDDHHYVVKFKDNPQGNRALYSEYVVGKLGEMLQLPIPRFKLVTISESFIKSQPALASQGFKSGLQFASRYMTNSKQVRNYNPRPLKNEIVNRQHAAGIIVFDHWVGNSDRNSKNIILQSKGKKGYTIYMIDHGNCFYANKPGFVFKPLELMRRRYEWLGSLLNGNDELTSFMEKIAALPNADIRRVFQTVPEEWGITVKVREAAANHLIELKRRLPNVIADFD